MTTRDREWAIALEAAINAFVDEYEFDDGESIYHVPTEQERALITDAIHGLLVEPAFVTGWRKFCQNAAILEAAQGQEPIEMSRSPGDPAFDGAEEYERYLRTIVPPPAASPDDAALVLETRKALAGFAMCAARDYDMQLGNSDVSMHATLLGRLADRLAALSAENGQLTGKLCLICGRKEPCRETPEACTFDPHPIDAAKAFLIRAEKAEAALEAAHGQEPAAAASAPASEA